MMACSYRHRKTAGKTTQSPTPELRLYQLLSPPDHLGGSTEPAVLAVARSSADFRSTSAYPDSRYHSEAATGLATNT